MSFPVRDTQLSLVEGMERPVGPLPLSVQTGTNADLIAKVAPLYLTGSVLDVTYGRGKWWDKFMPEPFVFHDLHTVDGVDFRDLPHGDDSFDTVCFDPPYIPQGGDASSTSTTPQFTTAFGLESRSEVQLWELIAAGLGECNRVARDFVLVKCMDFVNSGRFNLGHRQVLDVGRDLGMDVHDLIVHNAGSGPGGHNITTIKRARRAHSYLLVFAPSSDLLLLGGEDRGGSGRDTAVAAQSVDGASGAGSTAGGIAAHDAAVPAVDLR